MKLNHNRLVKLAAKWLRARHSVVITEMAVYPEEADAIGWKAEVTTLIECKMSRADFLADQKKMFRRMPDTGMGDYRYFLAPRGIINRDDLPVGWGLLEVGDRGGVRRDQHPLRLAKNHGAETRVLLSCLRRIGANAPDGVSISTYNYETKNRATLGVKRDSQT